MYSGLFLIDPQSETTLPRLQEQATTSTWRLFLKTTQFEFFPHRLTASASSSAQVEFVAGVDSVVDVCVDDVDSESIGEVFYDKTIKIKA